MLFLLLSHTLKTQILKACAFPVSPLVVAAAAVVVGVIDKDLVFADMKGKRI